MANFVTSLSEWANARRKLVWLLLVVLVMAVVLIVLTPMYLIAPFKAQTPRVMEVSYVMKRWSPFLTIVASLVILTLTIRLWLGGRWWSRIILMILLLPVLGATWLARQNHFEWMFNPLPNPAYAKVAETTFVKDDERVMAVTLGEESVAYPITLMAYHHVLGDTVGGTPIVATY
jgi:Protein of unknown function (DUF3179)